MTSHLWGWLCKKHRNIELAWTTWDRPMGVNADHDNLHYYTYHDIILPGSVLCVRAVPSVPANDPRGRGGASAVSETTVRHGSDDSLTH
eukprot:2360552-Amphidinium_carterae.1